jgi:PAS domain S-box-containing protein
MDSIRSVLRNFIRQEEEALVQRDSKLQVEMRRMFAVLVAASLVALLCALIFVASLKRGSEMRLKNLVYLESQRFLEIQQEANQQLQRTNLTLEISEEKLAVTLKSIGDGVIATDAAGRVTLLNPLAEQLTGWTQADATGRPMGEILSIIDHDTRQPATLPARDGEGPGPVPRPADSVLLRARDGSERAIDGGSAPIRNREGQVAGTVQVFRDVTDRQRADRELRRALAELNQANADLAQGGRLKDEFLANMSHELRTPLNAILGLSEALLEQATGPLTPRQAKSIGIIATSGTHLLTLINDILDLSKVEAGKLELSPETLNLQDFCESCLLFVRTQAIQKNIGVAFEPGDRAVKFSADPKRLKQILVNLLTNAVKFTPEGGHIGLTVAESKDGDLLRFTVWDTGIGIAPADERKLFRAFTQIDSGLTRAQEGTGLGLALVAKLVELHGGGLTLESEPGKGSRFIVTLPQVAAALAPPSALKVWADRRGYSRALVIEDDTTSGAILVNYLTELGLSSVLHARGEQSVEAVLRERPDVILLDVQLPGDSGWVVLVRLKEHPGTRDIPVVIVSVVDEPGRSRALGAAAHFTKPVTRAQLAGFLQRDPVTVLRSPAIGALPLPSGPTILLAEDNEANIQTMGGYLEDKGYRMHYARDGLEAVKLVRELHPELILMDIQMPVMDGLAAIREIRRDPALTAIPIVALTALAMPGDRDRCLAAGATDYMSKPVSMKALAELVKRLAPPMVPSLQPASS